MDGGYRSETKDSNPNFSGGHNDSRLFVCLGKRESDLGLLQLNRVQDYSFKKLDISIFLGRLFGVKSASFSDQISQGESCD